MILTFNEIKYTTDPIRIYSDVPLLETQISSGNFTLQTLENGAYVDVPITSVTVPDPGYYIEIITNETIQDKIYTLTAISIESVENEIQIYNVFRFLSIKKIDETNIANKNNVYTQLKWIDNVLSTDYILNHQEDFTFALTPSNYNFDTKKYEYSDETVYIKNNELILDKLVGQYFTEYKTFYDAINSASTVAQDYDKDYINNLHLVFFNNIVKWYSLKGNRIYIELMIALYAKYLGYNILSVVEDPVQNFVYRVSTSIPTSLWNTHIKPIIHPLSWKAIYNEITSKITDSYLQTVDWLNLFSQSKYHINSYTRPYVNNTVAPAVIDTMLNNQIAYVNDFEYNFSTSDNGLCPNGYDAPSGASYTVTAPSAASGGLYNTKFEFKYPGIITSYEWTLYNGSTPEETLTTYLNYVYFQIPDVGHENYTVGLKIYFKNGSYTLLNKSNSI